MAHNTIDDYQWLLGSDAVAASRALQTDPRSLVQQVQQLRKNLTPGRVHLLLELHELRQRATVKFDAAQRMFFTRRGLEQATDQWIAHYKAARFPPHEPVADLCCGIGGDLFGLAVRGETLGVDRDPIHALLAQANCQTLGSHACRIRNADATEIDLDRFAAWHIDPDRRAVGRRTSQLDYSSPTIADLERLLQQHPHAAIKSAPAADLPQHWLSQVERQWIGSGRECRQQVAWFGNLALHPGRHSAAVVHHRETCSELLVGSPDEPTDVATSIGNFVCEPHATVLAARLTGSLARKHHLLAVDDHVGYLTSNQPIDDPLVSCFAVLDVLPFDMRHVRSALERHDIGSLEVKKRGVTVEPDVVRRKLQVKGRQPATIIITPHAGSVRAILCRRATT